MKVEGLKSDELVSVGCGSEVYRTDSRTRGAVRAPPYRTLRVVLWGLDSDEVDARLTAGTHTVDYLRRTRLRPHDWKSGDKAWVLPKASKQLVEVIAPFGGGDAMVADLKAQVFKERELRALVMTDGREEVRAV